MKYLRSIGLVIGLSLAAGGCGDESATEAVEEPVRTAIGKADLAGSCASRGGDSCGGKSVGNCWCDDWCAAIGDCCSDRDAVCNPDQGGCVDGVVETTITFSASNGSMECAGSQEHCITNDGGACPQFSPLPPDWCADGDVATGPASYTASADGKECKIPSVHCLTRDLDNCPQFSPLPPGYCADGQLIQGADVFISSADGKECRIPSIHCVTDDEAACNLEPAFCPDGTTATETGYVDSDDGKQCATPVEHCLTDDFGACPQLSPLPPDYCADGDVVAGEPSYISSADGMECQMPSVHCVTKDFDACPQFSPLPPDFCSDGEVVSGAPSFIPSTDGMECQLPSVHCLSASCEG